MVTGRCGVISVRQRRWGLGVAGGLLLLAMAFPSAADNTKSTPQSMALQCFQLAAEWWGRDDQPGIEFEKIDPATAIPICQRAVQENPENADLKAYLCFALIKNGRQKEAVSLCQQAADAGSLAGEWGLNLFSGPHPESTLEKAARPNAKEAQVAGHSADVYNVKFRDGESAIVAMTSDGDTDLDLYVYDEKGNLICQDTDCTDSPICEWTPARTGLFRIKVVNRGNVFSTYELVIKTAETLQHQLAVAAHKQLEQQLAERRGLEEEARLPQKDPALKKDVTRYPTIETQDEVIAGREFAVQVSLTEEQITPEVQIKQGDATAKGQLALALPPDRDAWPIDVALSADGFTFRDNRNTATLSLPRSGDSTPALFHLTPKAIDQPTLPRKLYVTFWHQGQYLAKVVRPIQVVRATDSKPSAEAIKVAAVPRSAPPAQPIALAEPETPVDLTVFIAGSTILLHSPHLALVNGALAPAPEKTKWLTTQFAQLSRTGRGFTPEAALDQTSPKDAVIAHAKGFGKALYQEFAPPEFRAVFWRLKDQLGENFQSIQIYTDNPDLPWELMRPVRPDGSDEQDFLGMSFRLARWHVSQNANVADRPPPRFPLRERLVIAPDYSGARSLPSVAAEVDNLKQIGFQRVNGRFEALRELFDGDALRGDIVHFAGHGLVKEGGGGTAEYAIQLENGQELNILMWRGLASGKGQTAHPLVFFNACDLGQAHRVANFVEGWAPTVLESGASGYIGGLWSIGDRGAAEFAADFYRRLAQQLREGPALLADALRQTRQRFYQTGDPTFLAYVYYGDPNLALVKE